MSWFPKLGHYQHYRHTIRAIWGVLNLAINNIWNPDAILPKYFYFCGDDDHSWYRNHLYWCGLDHFEEDVWDSGLQSSIIWGPHTTTNVHKCCLVRSFTSGAFVVYQSYHRLPHVKRSPISIKYVVLIMMIIHRVGCRPSPVTGIVPWLQPLFMRIVELLVLTLIVVLALIVMLTSTVLHLLYDEQKGLWNSWSMHRIRGCQEISAFGSLKTYDLTDMWYDSLGSNPTNFEILLTSLCHLKWSCYFSGSSLVGQHYTLFDITELALLLLDLIPNISNIAYFPKYLKYCIDSQVSLA